MAQPKTIHDFGGFPQELFDQQYPAPGDPAAAQAISLLVRQRASEPLGLDVGEWGLDHGSWSVLKPMFPGADIPVIQLSMDYSRAPDRHYALARQLKALRDRGVLIVGSGNIVHNLRQMQRGPLAARPTIGPWNSTRRLAATCSRATSPPCLASRNSDRWPKWPTRPTSTICRCYTRREPSRPGSRCGFSTPAFRAARSRCVRWSGARACSL